MKYLFLLTLLFLTVSCAKPLLEGTYISNEKIRKQTGILSYETDYVTIEFIGYETVIFDKKVHGKYTVDDDKVTLQMINGTVAQFLIQDDRLVSPNGQSGYFIKQ